MIDVGLTHIALPVTDVEKSVAFYSKYARMQVVHRRSEQGALNLGPYDSGYPVGYWAFISDPDGHTLEVSHGQEVALTVDQAT